MTAGELTAAANGPAAGAAGDGPAGGPAEGAPDEGGPADGAAAPGPDGLPRCPWALSTADYIAYHDTEWGRPVRDDVGLFERITLEAFQSGLSWLTILRKRPAFRAAFAGFDPAAVAAFGPAEVEALLANPGIVRNRRKIEATITNARAVLALPRPLTELVWSFAPPPRPAPARLGDLPAATAESKALSKALKAHGFVFVGPTTAYALMQAAGLVNDHLTGCWVRGESGPRP